MRKLCFILLTLFCGNSFAANQYVDPSFTGTSNGTITNPWKSIGNIQWSSITAGDSILFKRGQKFQGTLTVGKSGTASSRIVLGAYGTGANPLFWGTGTQITQLFYLCGRSYVTFQDLTIMDTTISATDRTVQSRIQRGFVVDCGSNNVIIRRCKVDRVGVGVYLTPGSNSNTVEYSEMGNLRMVVNTNDGPPPGNDNDYGANPLVISSSNNIIQYNNFHDCWAVSFDYGIDGGAIDIYADNNITGNVIQYNTLTDCNGMLEIGGTGGYSVTNTTLAYNKAINNGSILYVSNSGTFQTNATDIKFYNNTIVESEAYRLIEPALFSFKSAPTTANSLILKNNAFYLYGTIDVCRSQWGTAGALVNQNNVYKLGSGSVLNFTQGGTETVTTLPLSGIWQNTSGTATAWDLTPAAGSPLIDKGQSLGYSTDFNGKAITGNPDAGIMERAGVTTQPIKALLKFVE